MHCRQVGGILNCIYKKNTNVSAHNAQRSTDMEDLLVTIGELISTEINQVKDIEYVDKDMGYMFYINLQNGHKILLSLIDSNLDQ